MCGSRRHPHPYRGAIEASRRVVALGAVVWMAATAALATDPLPHVTSLAGPLDGAVGGVTVDAVGFVYVADFGEKVWKISPWGDVEVLVDSLYGASGNTIDSNGDLLQSSFFGHRVDRIARDGSVTTIATDLSGPVGLVEGKRGEIYVCNCNSNSISRIESDGEVEEFASGDLFRCPNGITKDGDGNLYVVNFQDTRVIRITPEGEASLFATLPGGGNGHIVWVGPDLFVTGFRSNQIYRVGSAGEATLLAGSGAFGEQDGQGREATFSSPNGIGYDRARDVLYVNDHLIPWSTRSDRRTRPKSSVRRIELPTLKELVAAIVESEGPEAAKERVRAFRAARPGSFIEPLINLAGYQLLQAGNLAAALVIFEMNTEVYPGSANAWDSLAEGQMIAGNRDKAVEFYRKSLELNPGNENAAEKLKELGEGSTQ